MDNKKSEFQDTPIKELSEQQAAVELEWLANEILLHDQLYEESSPKITDAEYDALRRRNTEIENKFPLLRREDSPSHRVGYLPESGFKKVQHNVPMLSLDNIFDCDQIQLNFTKKILNKLEKIEKQPDGDKNFRKHLNYVVEPKVDGVSCAIRYENRKFVQAATRGDGRTGEDVTLNVINIKDVPKTLPLTAPDRFEVRGEVYMTEEDLLILNKHQEGRNGEIFKNPRNATSGSLRQLDPKITAQRPLRFLAYSWGETSEPIAETLWDARERLSEWGFKLNEPSRRVSSPEEIVTYYKEMEEQRSSLGYPVDGLVYKVDSLKLQNSLGNTNRGPVWAIAHKFPAERAITHLKKIIVSVGRTGKLTPTAELEPVGIGGVTVSSASLHNADDIARKDIRIGDSVVVQRAGDVIPQVISVVIVKRALEAEPYEFPQKCPSCDCPVERQTGEADLFCINTLSCPAQLLENIKHFVSRKAFDIEGLGEKNVEYFVNEGLIKNSADIFLLENILSEKSVFDSDIFSLMQHTPLDQREGWGKKSAEKLFQSIREKRSIELGKFIYALGIPRVGIAIAQSLAQEYKTIQNFIELVKTANVPSSQRRSQLAKISGIGGTAVTTIIDFFSEPHNQNVFMELVSLLDIKPYEIDINSQSLIAGKTIVFTGKFENMTREDMEDIARKNGAIVKGQVSKSTDIVVAGPGSGGKSEKAKEYGIEIISEQEWETLLRKGTK